MIVLSVVWLTMQHEHLITDAGLQYTCKHLGMVALRRMLGVVSHIDKIHNVDI